MKVECNLCNQVIEEEDLDFLGHRCDRHEAGRHHGHKVPDGRNDNKTMVSKPLGYFIIGEAEWITL